MRKHLNWCSRAANLGSVAAWLLLSSSAVHGCTIFFLTDTDRTLFCNNEDWKATKPKIWFVPGGKHYGCAYVGFVTQVSQGGCNTHGLAFDWVAGYREKWVRDPKQKIVRGIPHERMLETCTTVDEAIAFYRTHWDPVLSYAKMLLADRTGASAILGAHDGQFQVFRTNASDGFGYGGEILGRTIHLQPEPALTNAVRLLQATRQEGKYGTKYSNVFDLNSGDIFLLLPGSEAAITLSLTEELQRGAHWYDMSRIAEQRRAKPKRLSHLLEWVKNIVCSLRYSRPSPAHQPNVAPQSSKGPS